MAGAVKVNDVETVSLWAPNRQRVKARRVDWREAERLAGRRLDRRVAYWRAGHVVCEHAPFVVGSIAKFTDSWNELLAVGNGKGLDCRGQGHGWQVVEGQPVEGETNLVPVLMGGGSNL